MIMVVDQNGDLLFAANDRGEALLVADDVGNTVWRVTSIGRL
jgi:hypothetical protein